MHQRTIITQDRAPHRLEVRRCAKVGVCHWRPIDDPLPVVRLNLRERRLPSSAVPLTRQRITFAEWVQDNGASVGHFQSVPSSAGGEQPLSTPRGPRTSLLIVTPSGSTSVLPSTTFAIDCRRAKPKTSRREGGRCGYLYCASMIYCTPFVLDICPNSLSCDRFGDQDTPV